MISSPFSSPFGYRSNRTVRNEVIQQFQAKSIGRSLMRVFINSIPHTSSTAGSSIHFEQLNEAEVAIALDKISLDFLDTRHLHDVMCYVPSGLVIARSDYLTYDRDKQRAQT